MDDFRFRGINHRGKREYVFDPKGSYIRFNGEFIKKDSDKAKVALKTPNNVSKSDTSITKEINNLLKICPKVRSKVKKMKNLDKKLFYVKAWVLTESNDLTKLRNHDRRGWRAFHLDHIYPLSLAYKNGISPEAVADMRNLRFVHYRTNLKKRDTLTERGEKVMKEILNS